MEKHFSIETKELIGKAKEVALDLGDDRISTIHFFIGNCLIDGNYSPKEFLFTTEDDFNKFYASQRMGDSKNASAEQMALPLTNDASESIRLSLKLKKKIKSELVEPVHLLLACCKIRDSELNLIAQPRQTSYKRLYRFYKNRGYIIEQPTEGIIKKIKKTIVGLVTNRRKTNRH